MLRRFILIAGLVLPASADAAYMPGGTTVIDNQSGQAVGTVLPGPGNPTIPQINQAVPNFPPTPTPVPNGAPPPNRFGNFLDAIGRGWTAISDGVYNLVFAGPNGSPQSSQPAAVMNLSPNPSLQCPFTAPVNQTANATVIANPGGNKVIHVCGVMLVSATQQGVTVLEGTGTACATNPVYWDGGSGGTVQVAANGGFVLTSFRITYPMQVAGDNVCVIQSGAGNISGHINYGVFNR